MNYFARVNEYDNTDGYFPRATAICSTINRCIYCGGSRRKYDNTFNHFSILSQTSTRNTPTATDEIIFLCGFVELWIKYDNCLTMKDVAGCKTLE